MREEERGVSLEGGEQMEHRPPLPICAEGGGTQLLGSRDHSLAQGLSGTPALAELPAWPPPHPRCKERKEGGQKG